MNSKTFFKAKVAFLARSFQIKIIAGTRRKRNVMKNMAKNKSLNFHNLSRACERCVRKSFIFSFEERRTIFAAYKTHAYTLAFVRAREESESDGRESEHVIKTFTHEIEISLICFHFFHLSKREKNEIHHPILFLCVCLMRFSLFFLTWFLTYK